jgi:AraC family transcriptional regulator
MENLLIRSARCAVMSATYHPRAADAAAQAVNADTVLILVPGEQGDAVVIALDRGFCLRKAREALGPDAPEPVERPCTADPLISGVGKALRGDFGAGRVPSGPFLESLAGVIAIHLAHHYSSGRAALRATPGLAPHKLERVQIFVEQHLAEPVRVEQLAAAVHMSPFHFARMFKQATGQPPHAYLTAQRVERAKTLLREGRLALIEVAASVGFQTQGHFTEVFRRYAGVTPRIFRIGSNGRNHGLTHGQTHGLTPGQTPGLTPALTPGRPYDRKDAEESRPTA